MSPRMIDIITADACKIFDLEEEYLFELKVDNGINYLSKRFEHDPQLAEALKSNAKFWTWWRELWAERDRKLLTMCVRNSFAIIYRHPIGKSIKLRNGDFIENTALTHIAISDACYFYTKYHTPDQIQFYPNYVLINECLRK